MRSKFSRIGTWVGALTMASLLSACVVQRPYGPGYGYEQPPSQPQPYPQQQPTYGGGYGQPAPQGVMEYGVVSQIEAIPRTVQRGSTSGVGAILGAVVGGVLGNQIGGGMGRAAMTAAGALGGAAAGNAIEGHNAPRGEVGGGYRLFIQLDRNGGQRVYDVPEPGDLRPGDRVQMVNGQISRY
ncbi:glycine zipper 2TM domain-containing protein [Diaphorobacter caeni]|uniref:glycine zipper 2TM domain-containing protein n=1 Tax=Diaphorobacter caeni TaxID=2784387 RepID=UPI00188F264B|nr:glycine zipper 2TM domain-containing protein [Diaphorobacter caeni]MBF5003471.1 glycine zipper 2TM domain-containing protein [Diaphorobacter caeni]